MTVKSPTLQDLQAVYHNLASVKLMKISLELSYGNGDRANEPVRADSSLSLTSAHDLINRDDDTASNDSSEREYDTDSTLEPEPQPDLIAFLYTVADKMRDTMLRDDEIAAYVESNMDKLIDAFLDPALGLRYLAKVGENDSSKTPTLLHLAAYLGRCGIIPFLLENCDDPTITNGHPPLFTGGKTPYEISKDRETRDAFRRYRADHEDEEDIAYWTAARIPHGLTKEQELEREKRVQMKQERNKAKRKAKEQKRRLQKSQLDNESSSSADQRTSAILPQTKATPSDWKRRGNVLGTNLHNTTRNNELIPNRPVSPNTQQRMNRELCARAVEERIRRLKGSQ